MIVSHEVVSSKKSRNKGPKGNRGADVVRFSSVLMGLLFIRAILVAATASYTLTANEVGQGTVTSTDGKINCSNGAGACSATTRAERRSR